MPCARIFGRIDEGGGSSIPVEMEMLLSLWLPSVALGLPLSLSLTTISKLITDSDIGRIICVCLVVRFFVWSRGQARKGSRNQREAGTKHEGEAGTKGAQSRKGSKHARGANTKG